MQGEIRMDNLITALLDGNQTQAILEARTLLESGVDHKQIITGGVEAAMAQLDARCTIEQFNLLEIMLCGRAAMGVMKELYPVEEARPQTKGGVVLASLEGDVHDLGKNIFKMILTVSGYRVIDCGKDCPLPRLVEIAAQQPILAVGVSGLITTVIPQVSLVKEQIGRARMENVCVIAGGAALKQATPDGLNVDYVAQSAFDGLHYLEEMIG